ncbi:MAG TPA: hybrid sensor histidine kinase/response regulator [Kiritimatiellia bacterium]|nr:hybrid sensor histidine kinase/response regulator [Kiritimatiellia bacterium]
MSAAPYPKILVIDDEQGPRESLRILLKNTYQVFLAEGVLAGLKILREECPDLVIMDIRMPGMNGIEGLQHIRAIDKDVAVIMLTGFGALETAQKALRHGANDYLKKPFEVEEILSVISTNLKRVEMNRRRNRTERDLSELNMKLVKELAKKDRLASLGQASAELVHDLRNPMSIVLGYTQLLTEDLSKLRDGADSMQAESALHYLEIIEKSAKRCKDLTEVWRNLGRKDPDSVRPIEVNTLLKSVVDEIKVIGRSRPVEILLEDTPETLYIFGDATQITRTLNNIASNALDAFPDEHEGRIVISGKRCDQHVVISICDNGSGIPPDMISKVFDPYVSTKGADKGTGLGLFIAKKIIDDHKGSIQLTSEVGKGTTVSIRLPIWEKVNKLPATTPCEAGANLTM